MDDAGIRNTGQSGMFGGSQLGYRMQAFWDDIEPGNHRAFVTALCPN